ncbi:S8 family serine peptidase [Phytomonospora sp. NPDC050363]|uniref:S8 family serine peptidase n=1 Tax=Phytomonospora sp. NPDC050363 TaxID=3155642 RepID=UPI0033F36DB8
MKSTNRRLGLVLASAVTLAVLSAPGTAAADPAPSVPSGSLAWPSALPPTATVTLVTGDTITVSTGPDGKTGFTAVPAEGTSPIYRTETSPEGDTFIYPDSASAGMAAGLLDRDLFNITRLVADGHGDADSATLPLIVDYSGTPSAATLSRDASALDAVTASTPLASIGASAVEVDKAAAEDFYREATSGAVERISLDGRVDAVLDVSVPLIGAPEVWDSGFDGTGVKVAVLDTGIDETHPDFAGHISATASFIDGEAVADLNGHGTHVASTIMGSGAASGGAYKGVAPGVDLLVGKVLNNRGSGNDSGIIAGMEWAAAQGADVISMSLGGATQEVSDPMTEAVEALTASTGVLFVIAAGNSGPGESTVGSPGIADSALTVGAFDKSDRLADFSSRGPRVDGAIKPEIAGPGVDIVAARASGTAAGRPVDDHYTSLSGTSMATPHVAGAVALLVQQHPDWTARQLKDALVSTADNAPEYTVYEQGGGRLAVDEASKATVFASSTADFGNVGSDAGPQTRAVTYTNTGDAAVTLSLALNLDRGNAVPAGAVALSATTLDVPAHGTADVTVTVDPSIGEIGRYNGYLAATANGRTLTTSVGYIKAPPQRTMTFHLTGRDGEAAGQANIDLLDVATDAVVYRTATTLGEAEHSITVPQGRYAVQIRLTTYDDGFGTAIASTDYYGEPEIVLDEDVTLDADARDAVDVTAGVRGEKRPMEAQSVSVHLGRVRADGAGIGLGDFDLLTDGDSVYGVIPSVTKARHGEFTLNIGHELRDPILTATIASGHRTKALDVLSSVVGLRFDGDVRGSVVAVGAGTEADYAGLDVTGKLVLAVTDQPGGLTARIATAAAHGAAGLLQTRATPGTTAVSAFGDVVLPAAAVPYDAGRDLIAALGGGAVTVTLKGRMDSRFTYSLPVQFDGKIPARPTATADRDDFAKLANDFHADRVGRLAYDSTLSWFPTQPTSSRVANYHWAPGERDDYVYARDGVVWQQAVRTSTVSAASTQEPVTSFKAGRTYHRDWSRAPGVPAANGNYPCPMCRTDSGSLFAVAPFGDSDPTHYGSAGAANTVAFFRDGVRQDSYDTLLVPEEASYRIDYGLTRTPTAVESLGTKVDTSWTFRSAAPTSGMPEGCAFMWPDAAACEALPVILTGYDVPLDLYNQAHAGSRFGFEVTTSRPAGYEGPGVTGMTVEVSYDDGSTWASPDRVKLGRDGTAEVSLHHPKPSATNGFVSLRVVAWDAAGNRTEQTVIRAYALV